MKNIRSGIYRHKSSEKGTYSVLIVLILLVCFLPKNLASGLQNFKPVNRSQLMEIVKNNHPNSRLVKAIIQVESGWRPNAVSSKGAIGLMQVMPSTAKLFGFSKEDLNCPAKNILAGIAILKYYQRTSPNLRVALAKYSGGSRHYHKRVMKEL